MSSRIEVAKPYLDEEEQKAVAQAIATGWVAQGPKVKEFEDLLASYVGAKYAIAVTSCTTALHSALAISGVGPGAEVIVPSLSFIATANSVVHCGAQPKFADIDPETLNMDPEKIEGLITGRTKAIMPVHQVGLPADLDAVKRIADKHGLHVVEDAACAIGSEYKGKRIGGHGNIACFSFHPRKVITTGEGGMITTDDSEVAARLRRFRHHGMSVSDLERHEATKVILETYGEVGYNYRMTDLQAAMGIVQMRKLPEILAKRIAVAKRYDEALSEIPYLKVPRVPAYAEHNYQSYWIEVRENAPLSRDELMDNLLKKGISTRRGIMAIHKEPCYRGYNVSLPVTERITASTVILPLYPSMSDEETQYVIDEIKKLLI
jgi:dTDP-4-amino-4,6-dideoxygalactose transaminase